METKGSAPKFKFGMKLFDVGKLCACSPWHVQNFPKFSIEYRTYSEGDLGMHWHLSMSTRTAAVEQKDTSFCHPDLNNCLQLLKISRISVHIFGSRIDLSFEKA